ncbi:hypothetical protein FQN57_003644 [Myotisia sp. PD_48]|nr:hypothetical protein FQN57_003644 [Myotisia sp. PD_48]
MTESEPVDKETALFYVAARMTTHQSTESEARNREVVGGTAAVLQLAKYVLSLCNILHTTYKSAAGFNDIFDSVLLGVEVQVQRLTHWGDAVNIETCSPNLVDLLDRVLENVRAEIQEVAKYIDKYRPVASTDLASRSVNNINRASGALPGAKSRTRVVERIQFAIADKESLLSHAAKLQRAIDQLHTLVPLQGQLDLRLLAGFLKSDDVNALNTLAYSTGTQSYRDIQSSARIKVVRLTAVANTDALSSGDGDGGDSISINCHLEHFEFLKPWGAGKVLGTYMSAKVLIEWKPYSDEISKEESKRRITDISRLLRETGLSRPKDLITLDCLGCIEHGGAVGLVYVLPTMLSQSDPTSLHDLISKKGTDRAQWPAWEQRRSLACSLARAVFQLHVVGWLHKGIRPQNVVFFGSGKTALKFPYLIGFDYARRGDDGQKTEQTNMGFDLYRHPRAQGEVRSRFDASFDLFALGLVLLEIGLWQSFEEIRTHYQIELRLSKKEAQCRLHEELLNGQGPITELSFQMGSNFEQAVIACLITPYVDLTADVYITDIIGRLEAV